MTPITRANQQVSPHGAVAYIYWPLPLHQPICFTWVHLMVQQRPYFHPINHSPSSHPHKPTRFTSWHYSSHMFTQSVTQPSPTPAQRFYLMAPYQSYVHPISDLAVTHTNPLSTPHGTLAVICPVDIVHLINPSRCPLQLRGFKAQHSGIIHSYTHHHHTSPYSSPHGTVAAICPLNQSLIQTSPTTHRFHLMAQWQPLLQLNQSVPQRSPIPAHRVRLTAQWQPYVHPINHSSCRNPQVCPDGTGQPLFQSNKSLAQPSTTPAHRFHLMTQQQPYVYPINHSPSRSPQQPKSFTS